MELVNNAKLYRSIYEVDYGNWSKQENRIEQALESLGLFRVVQPIPCVLSLLREYKISSKIKKKHTEDALVSIEKFHFLFTAVTSQRSSGGISKMYALHARELHEAKDTQAAVKVISELREKLRTRVPSLQEFVALFPEILYTNTLSKQRNLARYILVGLDRQQSPSAGRDYSQMTIEHLYSQSDISDSMPESIVGQVGNLLLLPEQLNAKLKNKSFREKKKLLKDSGFLPDDIAAQDQWEACNIEERTERMAKVAYEKVWKI
jgi:hypothetical protein